MQWENHVSSAWKMQRVKTMSNGLRYETGRDMPPGMAEKVAVQLARQLQAATPAADPEPAPVAGVEKLKRTISARDMENLMECLDAGKPEFSRILEAYTGLIAKPYIAFQYYYENGDYIGDSDTYSLEDVMEEAGIEVIKDET